MICISVSFLTSIITAEYFVNISLFLLTAMLHLFHFGQALNKQQRDRVLKGHRDRNEIRTLKWKVVHVEDLSEKTKHLKFHLGRKETQPFPTRFLCTYFSHQSVIRKWKVTSYIQEFLMLVFHFITSKQQPIFTVESSLYCTCKT